MQTVRIDASFACTVTSHVLSASFEPCNRFPCGDRHSRTKIRPYGGVGAQQEMRLAGRIRVARKHAGMSQQDLAAQLGVSRGAVANWESAGSVLPATERLQRIAQVTGTTFEWLATGRGASRYQPSLDDIPAAKMEIVEDPLELRLLRAFRATPQRQHAVIVTSVEARDPSARTASPAPATQSRSTGIPVLR